MSDGLSTQASAKELPDIRGGIIGFNKDLQTLVYVNFPSAASGRALLGQMQTLLSPADEVLKFNRLYKEATGRGDPPHDLRTTWTNLWITIDGLRVIEAPYVDTMPEDFRAGMAQRAPAIGDRGPSAPSEWVATFEGGTPPHRIVVVASDTQDDLDLAIADVQAAVGAAAVMPVGDLERDEGPPGGTEHFGFKDGISQPCILGLTTPSREPHEEIAAGEFLIGYQDEQGQVSGHPPTVPPPPPSTYDPTPPPPMLPSWCRNGSFVVYRRLRQNVGGFRPLNDQVRQTGLLQEQLHAKVVGRWPSGAPMEHVAGMPHSHDPTSEDVSGIDPRVLDDAHINNFDYSADQDGFGVPRAAHIRKTNSRSASLPGRDTSRRHRPIRRGIPYGPAYQPDEPPYGSAVPPSGIAASCSSAIRRQSPTGFEFVQRGSGPTPPTSSRTRMASIQSSAKTTSRVSSNCPGRVAQRRFNYRSGFRQPVVATTSHQP